MEAKENQDVLQAHAEREKDDKTRRTGENYGTGGEIGGAL